MTTRTVLVLATVVSIRDKFFYPCCAGCHKKVYFRDAEATILYCEECQEEYSAEKVEYRYRISVLASDRTQLAQITVFGSCLDKCFGLSATSFARFVNDLHFHPLPIPGNHLVVQAVEQCFVGSLLHFGFRVCSSTRTASQIAHNSPFHLNNIVPKIGGSEDKTCLSGGLPSLLACQIFPCYSADHQAPTVLQILNENLLEVRSRQRNTPQSFLLRRPQSQYLALVDCSQTEESCKACFGKSNTSLQGNGRTSPIYCTPQEFCAMITPLVLTGISQPSSVSSSTQDTLPGSKKLDRHFLGLKDQSDQVSSQEDDTRSNKSNSPRFTQLTSQTKEVHSEKLDICKEEQTSCEWTEYDDFPSSEDLSAFLADLELDAINKTKEQSQPIINSKMSTRPKPCVTSEEKTLDEMVTSQTVSLSDVVYGFVQEDYTEFTDFPSSEDLDAFLADLELGCGNILQKTSMTPADAVRSADPFELEQKVEVYRTFPCSEHDIKYIAKRNYTERSKKILDLADGDGLCAQEDSVRLQNSNSKSKVLFKIDLSHSELLRNCEHLFTESSEKSIPGKHLTRRKQKRHSSVNLQSGFMKNDNPTHGRDELIKKEKVLCGLESAEESREEEVVCTRSLQYQVLDKWSHDQKIKAEIRQAAFNQGNSYSSGDDVLIDSFEMMHTSPDLFLQSLSRAKVISSDTPYLYYSPKLLKGESHSWYSKHFSGTPDLFCSPNCSPNRQKINSVSLFSCSNHSLFSSSSSPLLLVEQPASSSDSNRNELDMPSIINQSESENRFVQNDEQAISFHSTPRYANRTSKRLHRMCTPAGVSPLLSDSRGPSPYNEPEISALGTPVLFSQMSDSSL